VPRRVNMMSDERDEQERGFKVQDRRRFTPEGEKRGESPPAGATGEPRPQQAPHPDAKPSELTFSSFVIGIASQAFVSLGAMPDPQSGSAKRDLPQAKAMIDILSMLSEKTAGNLDEHEAKMMEEMLYELRMHYVKELRTPEPEGGHD